MSRKRNTLLIIYAFLVSIILLLPWISFGTDTTTMTVSKELEKYINYDLSEEDKGTLVQYGISTKVEYGEEILPVKGSEVTVNLGQIDGKYPNDVKVISENDFESTSKYDPDTGTLVISVDDQKGKIESNYIAICNYDTFTEENEERQLDLGVKAKAIFSSSEEKNITQEEQFSDNVTENIGELTSVYGETQEVYNGYIKSNFINGTDYTTPFEQKEQVIISKKEAQTNLEIKENASLLEKETQLVNNNNLVYKSTQIQKEDIENLLGEEGIVEVLDENGELIETINKDTKFDEQGNYTINYKNDQKEITIKTSEIINEGIFNLKHEKEIKGKLPTVKELFTKTAIQINNEENTYELKNEIKDATTKIDVKLDNVDWSNRWQNEVTFDITLQSNNMHDNMFKNPYIRIELPNQVEKVILGESYIIYANGLELQTPYIETNEDGKQVIVAQLTGARNTIL